MKRRSFLQLLGAAPAVAIAPKLLAGKAKPAMVGHPAFADPFGLAQVKAEGGRLNYDSFAKELWPGINKWYAEAYQDVDLKKLYG